MFDVIAPPKLMTTREAAGYLKDRHGLTVAEKSLSKWRWSGHGPQFLKAGTRRVVYRPAALDAWATARLSEPMTSTAKSA